MPNKRKIHLLRNGRNQVLRIPREWELEGEEATIHREGDRLIVEPVRKDGLLNLLAGLQPIEKSIPEVDKSLLPLDDVKL